MKTFGFTAAIAAAGVLLSVASAQAQNNVSFVSGLGSDANKCTRADPCRNFAKALSVTNANGVITALDGSYAAFTINQPVSIVAPAGVYAEIIATSGNGITITGGNIAATVALTGLSIQGAGTGSIGIDITGGFSVGMWNCIVSGFTSASVAQTTANGGAIIVQNSQISNGTGSKIGTTMLLTGPASILSSLVLGGTTGISAGAVTTISDSYLANNGTAISNAAGVAVTITRNQITFNGTGVGVNSADGGAIYSYGDNNIGFNATNVSGSLTPFSKM